MTKRPAQTSAQKRSRARRNNSAGLEARLLALDILKAVLVDRYGLDEALEQAYSDERFKGLEQRDKAFGRLLAVTVLRNKHSLQRIIDSLLERPLKARAARANLILLLGAAQLLKLSSPAHAVIDTAVSLCRHDRSTGGFDRLTNAVLRRVAKPEVADQLKSMTATENYPEWMIQRWQTAYGSDATARIASACLEEAPLDITVKSDPEHWAKQLGGFVLPTGSIRCKNDGRIEDLPGYEAGAWWVQDTAATLPVRLLGDVKGLKVADLCAAPGGKTAQLAANGAEVVSVDLSRNRLRRVEQNLTRLELTAALQVADASSWSREDAGTSFDAVLVDAPCTATGTVRRHPDILHLKQFEDVNALSKVQAKILANAADLVKSGGLLIYCTCSMEPEECEVQIEKFLAENPSFARQPIKPGEIGGQSEMVTETGDLRTFPYHMSDYDDGLRGLDGFYACRMIRQ